jgi:hypothetical protein
VYDLFLNGMNDDTPDTNRRVKTALVGELHLSVEQVIALFSHPLPVKVITFSSEQLAKNAARFLEQAGAAVEVKYQEAETQAVSNGAEDSDDTELEFEFNLAADNSYQRKGTNIHHLPSDDLEEPTEEHSELSEDDIDMLVSAVSTQTVLQRAVDDRHTRLPVIPAKESIQESDPKTSDSAATQTKEAATVTPPVQESNSSEIETKSIVHVESKRVRSPFSKAKQAFHQVANTGKQTSLLSTVGAVVGICAALLALTFVSTLLMGGESQDSFLKAAVKGFSSQGSSGSSIPLGVAALKTSEANSGLVSLKQNGAEYSAEMSLKVKQGKLAELSFYLTSPAPPAPTDEQIVSGDRGLPWLRALRFEKPKLETRKTGEQIATAPAMAFISHAEERIREQATAVTTYQFDKKSGTASAEVLINKGFEQLPSEDFVFERTPEGTYKLFFRKTFKGGFDSVKSSETTLLSKGVQ